jgi:hypothetical protein
MATAVIPAATALLKARGRDDGSVELHHAMGHDPLDSGWLPKKSGLPLATFRAAPSRIR